MKNSILKFLLKTQGLCAKATAQAVLWRPVGITSLGPFSSLWNWNHTQTSKLLAPGTWKHGEKNFFYKNTLQVEELQKIHTY